MLSVGDHLLTVFWVHFFVFNLNLPSPALQWAWGWEAGLTGDTSVVMAVAALLDLNDLDSLSRTCRGVHNSLLQYRSILLRSTLHCSYEEVPVDPESTLRYRARAGNWYYMEDTSRTGCYNGKAGSCARDMVAKCRKCSTVICRVSLLPRLSLAAVLRKADD